MIEVIQALLLNSGVLGSLGKAFYHELGTLSLNPKP